MSTNRYSNDSSRDGSPTFASTIADERWQGPGFAASWISPPSPHREADDVGATDPTAPFRGDDHA